MARIRIFIKHPTENKKLEARVEADTDIERLIPAIVTSLKLPIADSSGRLINYNIAFNNRQLQRNETLRSAGVSEGEEITVVPEIIAGREFTDNTQTNINANLINVLHLSDLHFGTTDNARTWYAQLAEDLRYELGCSHLDALIISGDIASKSTPDEYAAAQLFINRLSQEFQLEWQTVVIVPGNHDVNWQLAEAAYSRINTEYSQEGIEEYLTDENGEFIEGLDKEQYKRRFINFSRFYEAIKGELYPLEYNQQYSLQHLPEQNLLILGLNSAWQIDHRGNKYRASINSEALSNALSLIRRNPAYEDCLKIAVWHHPINSIYVDKIADNSVIESLAAAGFRLVLHGSVPSAENRFFHYDYVIDEKRVDVIGAGIFGIYQIQNDIGYPCQYNLLKIEENKVTVETRKRDEPDGVWKPDLRWNLTSELNPLPHYVISLSQENTYNHELYFERGKAYIKSGRYEDAIASLDQAIEIKPDFYEAWFYRGTALVNLERYEEAIVSLDNSIKIKPVDQAWNSRGFALFKLGQFEEAIASYDKAIEIKPDFCEAWLYRGEALTNLGRFEEAIHDYEQALVITQEIGDRSKQASCLNNLGTAYNQLGEYQQAIEFHQQSLAIAREIRDRSSEAISLSNLGNAYHSLKQYQQAIEYYKISLTIAREIGDRYGEVISLSNLGGAYFETTQGDRTENIESAIAVYTSLLEICNRESFPEQWAKTQNNLGLAFSERIRGNKAENLQTAIACYQAALKVYTREAFPYKWADTCMNIGNAYEKIHDDSLDNINCLNNIEYAILFYQDALEIYTHDQFPDECLSVREKLSNAHYLLEHYQREEVEYTSLPQPITRNKALARIELLRANILDLEVDVIVRPTNTTFGFGGKLSKQILERVASTSNLFKIMANPPRLSIGEIFVNDAENLSARYLFHMPIDVNVNATEATVLQAMRAALNKAESLSNVRTIAFPSVGTGLANLNPDDLASKILKTVASHFQNGSRLEKVIFAFIDTRGYQAYVIAHQMLFLETTVAYEILITTSQSVTTVAGEIELSINLRQVQTTKEGYLLQITQDEATGNELNIFLTAPGFQFNSDNTTSLPLDSDTININQTAIFNLTALRPGKTKIKAELYCI